MMKRILIAEDESIVALAMKRLLENNGYEVLEILRTGKATISSAIKLEPDLLILDIYLEDEIDGIDAANTIHRHKEIPVIYTSASTDASTIKKIKNAITTTFLKKPYSYDDLLAAIQSINYC